MKNKIIDRIAIGLIYGLVSIVVVLILSLIVFIINCGLPYISWHFLTSPSKDIGVGGGISDQLFNSFYLLVLTILISFPISLGAGIYLSEYAPADSKLTNIIRTMIEVLSSLPSAVVGLFGFLLFVIQFQIGFSILSGAFALTFFNLPILTRSIEKSLSDVDQSQREAGWSLGISKWHTILKIVFPISLPGIITGVILSCGRVFGEAAALIYTSGQSSPVLNYSDWNPFDGNSPLNIFRPAETLAVHIWKINTEGVMPDAVKISAGASAVLIIVILIFNLLARWIGRLVYRKLTATK